MEDIIISGRHFDVTDELKSYVHQKMERIAGEYHKLTTARIVMSVEKSRQHAEIQLEGKHLDIHAEAETHDMYASLDEAFDRIEVQLRKHLDRMQDHHARKNEPEPTEIDINPAEADDIDIDEDI